MKLTGQCDKMEPPYTGSPEAVLVCRAFKNIIPDEPQALKMGDMLLIENARAIFKDRFKAAEPKAAG